MKRARQTAEEINKFHNVKIKIDKRLREFNMGDFSKFQNQWEIFRDYREKEAKKRGVPAFEIGPPHGESEYSHNLRVESFLEDLLKDRHKVILIVAHGVTNKVFFGAIKHVSKLDIHAIKQGNCCLNEIEYNAGTWKVIRINCLMHFD